MAIFLISEVPDFFWQFVSVSRGVMMKGRRKPSVKQQPPAREHFTHFPLFSNRPLSEYSFVGPFSWMIRLLETCDNPSKMFQYKILQSPLNTSTLLYPVSLLSGCWDRWSSQKPKYQCGDYLVEHYLNTSAPCDSLITMYQIIPQCADK